MDDHSDSFSFFPNFIRVWIYSIQEKWTELNQPVNGTASQSCDDGDLTNFFAICVQLILGFLCFLILLIKWKCEPNQTRRPGIIAFLDISKQGFGMAYMHVINILLSEGSDLSDPCTFYIMSFILDASIGLVVIWTLCKVISFCIKRFNWMDGVPFGKYQKDDMHFRLSLNQNQHRENEHETSDQENEMDDLSPTTESSGRNVNFNSEETIINNTSHDQNHVEKIKKIDKDKLPKCNLNDISQYENQPTNIHSCCNPNNAPDKKCCLDFKNLLKKCISEETERTLYKIDFKIYTFHTLLYIAAITVSKVVNYIVLNLESLQDFYKEIRSLLTEFIPIKEVTIVIVLFVIPFTLNSLMMWVTDNILMMTKSKRMKKAGKKIKKFSKRVSKRVVPGGSCLPSNGSGNRNGNATRAVV